MKKSFLLFLALVSLRLGANEGKWMPQLIAALNYSEMQAMGLRLTPEQLYSINQSSVKDAVASLGGFCTAEIISSEGLLLTNHHCGYDAIQNHSTVEHDYLKDGFWAMDRSQEIPNQGLTASFVVRIEDVTAQMLAELNDGMSETERNAKIAEVGKKLADKACEGTHYNGFVRAFFHGNEFYLFVMETFKDVRLVGAPPSAIGKFGGDTDNWMWPRHTGDFSMFRIYTGPDGKPAEYAEDNIPLKPKHFFPINLDGVRDGDFSMVYGFPGRTDRYLSSYGVQQAIDHYNPAVVKVRDAKLAVMRKYMKADPAVNIQYASTYAQVANYWKYYIGQTEQLVNNKVYDKKKALEDRFEEWVKASPDRTARYGTVLQDFASAYAATDPYQEYEVYNREALLTGSSVTLFGLRAGRLIGNWEKAAQEKEAAYKASKDPAERAKADAAYAKTEAAARQGLQGLAEAHFKDFHSPLEQESMVRVFDLYANDIAPNLHPDFIAKNKGKFEKYVSKAWGKSVTTDRARFDAALAEPDFDKLRKDPMIGMAAEVYDMYVKGAPGVEAAEEQQIKAYRKFSAGLREMMPEGKFSPDANSTLRMSYGKVGSYEPQDGVKYHTVTTLQGILQKEDPNNDEFVVPARLKELALANDYGPYADENGQLVVNFISDNDITGGNSGSPVLNAYGELIGTAFDGNWEAMSGDIYFEDQLQRTISVDIRYTLFVVDKYAGARHLIDEMTLVRRR